MGSRRLESKQITQPTDTYHFARQSVIAVDYSNGANIARSLLFHYKDALKGGVLFHPMVPRLNIDLPDLSGIPVFISSGKNDPLCPSEETKDSTEILRQAGAEVEIHWEHAGHQLTRTEVAAAAKWYKQSIINKQ